MGLIAERNFLKATEGNFMMQALKQQKKNDGIMDKSDESIDENEYLRAIQLEQGCQHQDS